MTYEMSGLQSVFLGRTPILDRDRVPFGYEFFSPELKGQGMSASAFSADVFCRMFSELGLANALGAKKAFVMVDETVFAQGAIELVKERNVVLEVDARRPISAQLLTEYLNLRKRGHEFCISGITHHDQALARLLPLASYLKVDTRTLPPGIVRAMPALLGDGSISLMAAGIDTEEMFELCRDAGYRYFRGYFFARASIVEGRRLDTSMRTLFHLLEMLDAGAADAALEEVLKGDPALAINLLRLANSLAIAAGHRISSIRQAVGALGRDQLRRWLQLLVFTSDRSAASVRRNPLMQLAAMRAHFMEILAIRCYGEKNLRDPAFLTGLFSLMPVALGMTMVDVLSSVTVSPDVRRALSRREGELGVLLDLTEHYDNNDREATDIALRRLGGRMDYAGLGDCLSEVISRVESLAASTAGNPLAEPVLSRSLTARPAAAELRPAAPLPRQTGGFGKQLDAA